MAENEEIDFWKNDSPRRRALLARMKSEHMTVDAVAAWLLQDLLAIMKQLVKEGLVANLLKGKSQKDVLWRIFHESKASEFAQVFIYEASTSDEARAILSNTLQFFVDRVLDQIGQEAVPCENWPNFVAYQSFCDELRISLKPNVERIAKQLERDPKQPPRRPGRSRQVKERCQQELQRLSLMTRRRRSQ